MRADRWSGFPMVVALGVVLYWLGRTVAGRIGFGFDLEWMEGGMLVHALRVMNGQPIYADPTADWIPYIYPPLYAWLLGGLGKVFGLSYALGRGISVVGTLLAAALFVPAVRLEGGRTTTGLGAAALFLACYDDVGGFFDLVRNDGLLVVLWGAALVAVRAKRAATGGVLLALAFAAKHQVALFGLPCVWWLWKEAGWPTARRFVVASAGPALLFTGALEVATHGLFLRYLLDVPAHHPIVAGRLFPGAVQELDGGLGWARVPLLLAVLGFGAGWGRAGVRAVLPWALGVGAAVAATWWWMDHGGLSFLNGQVHRITDAEVRDGFLETFHSASDVTFTVAALGGLILAIRCAFKGPWTPGSSFWSAQVGLTVAMCMLMRGHHGGFLNVLIPGFWILALSAALAMEALFAHGLPAWLRWGLGLALIAQSWNGRWELAKFIPNDADRAAGEAVLERIRSFDGEVWMPQSPYYPVLVGKQPSLPLIALWDIDHPGCSLRSGARKVTAALAQHRWAAVITSADKFGYGLLESYEVSETIPYRGRELMPKTGWPVRPKLVYVPRAQNQPAAAGDSGPGDEP